MAGSTKGRARREAAGLPVAPKGEDWVRSRGREPAAAVAKLLPSEFVGPYSPLSPHRPRVMPRHIRAWPEEKKGDVLSALIHGFTLQEIHNDPDMPCLRTLYRWRHEDQEFAKLLEEALEFRGYVEADETKSVIYDRHLDARDRQSMLQGIQWRVESFSKRRFGRRESGGHGSNGPLLVIHLGDKDGTTIEYGGG